LFLLDELCGAGFEDWEKREKVGEVGVIGDIGSGISAGSEVSL
jgi:hypothetical protein